MPVAPVLVLEPLAALARPKLAAWLQERDEPLLDGGVVTKATTDDDLAILVLDGTPGARRNLLAQNELRVRVRARDSEFDADDTNRIASLVRAFFDGPLADGDPVTFTRVETGPSEVAGITGYLERYLVVSVTQKLRQQS